jgi:hypothetical protein
MKRRIKQRRLGNAGYLAIIVAALDLPFDVRETKPATGQLEW